MGKGDYCICLGSCTADYFLFHVVLVSDVTSNSIAKPPSNLVIASTRAGSSHGNSTNQQTQEIFLLCTTSTTFWRRQQQTNDLLSVFFTIIAFIYCHMAERCCCWWSLGLLNGKLKFFSGTKLPDLESRIQTNSFHKEMSNNQGRKENVLCKKQPWRHKFGERWLEKMDIQGAIWKPSGNFLEPMVLMQVSSPSNGRYRAWSSYLL